MPTYSITVYTGDVDDAGTDANVFISIYGSKGSTEEFQLDSGDNDFERGSVFNASFDLNDLGDLRAIHIRHDNYGPRPGWWLDKVDIRNEESNKSWSFPCHRWLARDELDHRIDLWLDRA